MVVQDTHAYFYIVMLYTFVNFFCALRPPRKYFNPMHRMSPENTHKLIGLYIEDYKSMVDCDDSECTEVTATVVHWEDC